MWLAPLLPSFRNGSSDGAPAQTDLRRFWSSSAVASATGVAQRRIVRPRFLSYRLLDVGGPRAPGAYCGSPGLTVGDRLRLRRRPAAHPLAEHRLELIFLERLREVVVHAGSE